MSFQVHVEVILRLGVEASADSIQSLQISIKENDGELELSNRASAKLTSVETLKPGKRLAQSMYSSVIRYQINARLRLRYLPHDRWIV